MEYSKNESSTPRFGYNQCNKTLYEELLRKETQKSTKDTFQNVKNKEKSKNKHNEKGKSKSKERSKNKNKERSKNKIMEKNKRNSKMKSNDENKSFKPKKNVYEISFSSEQKNVNYYDIFLKKKIILRNDFDQNHSEKFLSEKEFAFKQFQMSEDDDALDN